MKSQLERIGEMLKAKRDEQVIAAVNRVLADVEKSGKIPDDLSQRLAAEIEKVFDKPALS